MEISFFSHEIPFILEKQESVKSWLLFLVEKEGENLADLTYIFVSDDYLLALNKTHLDHDYYTDILTFPYSQEGEPIHGEIYISIDRVGENANTYNIPHEDEIFRVMAHGLLHLLGYDDHDETDIQMMRSKENEALAAWKAGTF